MAVEEPKSGEKPSKEEMSQEFAYNESKQQDTASLDGTFTQGAKDGEKSHDAVLHNVFNIFADETS
eukprot:CAMPEP_0117755980 /NCGR_PEP_ID=MMETSP0947-20121206/13781_1 /TAXON_ID=44440 /ORGANISM="Chattonella subsalsa, Strain CCMP2191" /LENGTH=65 /DNA_ID=CAMNT_0005575431 /DNA_START=475 /DNA_END=672 /DNA_ORIENTATION=+